MESPKITTTYVLPEDRCIGQENRLDSAELPENDEDGPHDHDGHDHHYYDAGDPDHHDDAGDAEEPSDPGNPGDNVGSAHQVVLDLVLYIILVLIYLM